MPKRRPRRAPNAGIPPPRAEEKSVLEITTSIAKGDPDAFALFYEEWFDRAFSLARRLTRRDESFCLDVVQDAMLRVVRSLRPMPDQGELARWMARVVRTTAIDLLRREARRIRREARWMVRRPADAAPDPSSAAECDEAIEWVRLELGKMPDGDRLLLFERFERGSTFEGAGRAAGMSGNAAHGRVRRALERLRGAARRVFRDGF